MTLNERKNALINQLNDLKAQKAEAEAATAQLDTGIKRLEGALVLIAQMQAEEAQPDAAPAES